jgi:hypothetical protein
MRRSLVIAVLLAVPIVLGAAPALAFQEAPVPPPAEAQEAPKAKAQSMPPAMKLGTPTDALQPEAESGGLFGFGLLPKLNPFAKLNFGLDVLYGDKQEQLEFQQGSKADEGGDVSVVGKVKRRF